MPNNKKWGRLPLYDYKVNRMYIRNVNKGLYKLRNTISNIVKKDLTYAP